MESYLQIGLYLTVAIVMVSGRPQYHGYPGAYYGAPAVPGAYGHYGAPGVPVQDTPEVAHAKAAHFAAFAAAAGGHHGGHHGGYYGGAGDHSGAYIHDPSGDHALPYVHDPSGDHDAPYNHYGSAGAYGGHGGGYYGPAAVPGAYHGGYYGAPGAYPYGPHGLPLPVQDTPEVAAAKAAHFAAHAAAKGHHYG